VVTRLTCARAKRLSIDSCSVACGGWSSVVRHRCRLPLRPG
jgi:hypothetical protein